LKSVFMLRHMAIPVGYLFSNDRPVAGPADEAT
jgi:hypothetical protein